MKQDDVCSLHAAIAGLAGTKVGRRYPLELKRRIRRWVRSQPEVRHRRLAQVLGMTPLTLSRILTDDGASVVPIRVVPGVQETPTAHVLGGLRVRGPCGLVVEGLDVQGVVELIRGLS